MKEGASRPVAEVEVEGPVCEHFQLAADIVGRRWNPQILRVLLGGCARYRDLKAAIPAISDHLLSQRLKELESAGIVTRKVGADGPVRVEYTLTDEGEGLADAIGALATWAERFARTRPGYSGAAAGRTMVRSVSGGPKPSFA